MVDENVRSGQHRGATEAHERCHRLAARGEDYEVRLQALQEEIQKGIDSLERGEGIPGDEAFARIREMLREGVALGRS